VKISELPLFPLRTVLVPGGRLSLQIFEPRYLDMVRECGRNDSGFGVCLILDGNETGRAPEHARIGTLARIEDFNTLPNGLLGLLTRGERRFRVRSTRVRDNGLLVGAVDWLEEAPVLAVPEPFSLLPEILGRFLEKAGDQFPGWDTRQLDDASWVGYRLTELLPFNALEKQALLELDDPMLRLQRLLNRLPDFLTRA